MFVVVYYGTREVKILLLLPLLLILFAGLFKGTISSPLSLSRPIYLTLSKPGSARAKKRRAVITVLIRVVHNDIGHRRQCL